MSIRSDPCDRLELVFSALVDGRRIARIELSERSIPMWEMIYEMQEGDTNPLPVISEVTCPDPERSRS